LRSSFWVDEMVTAFVVHYESAHPSLIVAPQAAGLCSLLKSRDWNEIHIIARGNNISQMFNGNAMSILIDDDAAHWAASGLIGIQMRGESAKLEIRNIRLKKLP